MNKHYWDRVADAWDEHIMCSLHEDRSGHIAALLSGLARTHRSVLDYGCGVGGYLPLLSARFGQVVAVDTSSACVGQAAAAARALPNVQVCTAGSLARQKPKQRFDAVLMANVLLHPRQSVRARVLRLALAHLRPRGTLVLVLPSVESALMAEAARRAFTRKRVSAYAAPAGKRVEPGVIAINGVATKHYAADEIALLLQANRLALAGIGRAEYSWSSEAFAALDRKLKQRPWDWVVSATRR